MQCNYYYSTAVPFSTYWLGTWLPCRGGWKVRRFPRHTLLFINWSLSEQKKNKLEYSCHPSSSKMPFYWWHVKLIMNEMNSHAGWLNTIRNVLSYHLGITTDSSKKSRCVFYIQIIRWRRSCFPLAQAEGATTYILLDLTYRGYVFITLSACSRGKQRLTICLDVNPEILMGRTIPSRLCATHINIVYVSSVHNVAISWDWFSNSCRHISALYEIVIRINVSHLLFTNHLHITYCLQKGLW